jgi:hypothetical protein
VGFFCAQKNFSKPIVIVRILGHSQLAKRDQRRPACDWHVGRVSIGINMADYYGSWKTDKYGCKNCGWRGTGADCLTGEQFKDLFEIDCPSCGRTLEAVTYPTNEESLANWDKVEEADKAIIGARKAFIDSASKALLTSPDELPEIDHEAICLIWDFVGHPTGKCGTVIRYGDSVIWTEPAFYDGIERFCEVVRILQAKYGRRLRDVAVAERSLLYLWGDTLSAPDIEAAVRDQLWFPEPAGKNPSSSSQSLNWKQRSYECAKCGWNGKGESCDTRHFARLFQLNCPNCRCQVGEVYWLTKSDLLKTGAVLSNSDQIMARSHDQLVRAATGQWLEVADQLPEIEIDEGEELLFVWDDEETETKRDLVIRYGAVEIWREPCFYGCNSRYPAISKILIQKYGDRLTDLIPTRRSCVEYKADRVEEARKQIIFNKSGKRKFGDSIVPGRLPIPQMTADEESPDTAINGCGGLDDGEASDLSDNTGEKNFEDDYFPFRDQEYWVIDELRKMIRDLTAVANSPETVRDLAAAHLAAERLPFNTPNLHLIVLIGDPEYCFQIEISEDRFALSYGGMVGSDGYGHTILEMETTGFRDGSTSPFSQLGQWFMDAKQLIEDGPRIEITDYEGIASLSWDGFDEEPWELYERSMTKEPDGPFYDLE